jgi:hypothetical protein
MKITRHLMLAIGLIVLSAIGIHASIAQQYPIAVFVDADTSLPPFVLPVLLSGALVLMGWALKVSSTTEKTVIELKSELAELRTLLIGVRGQDNGGMVGDIARLRDFENSISAQLGLAASASRLAELKADQLRREVDEMRASKRAEQD